MNLKKKWLEVYRLCVILNRPFFKDVPSLARAARKIASSGGGFIQLRDKESGKKQILETALILKKQLGRRKSIFIVNDHVDIAVLAGADGVHLGQDDLPLPAARKILGKDKIIGVSCLSLKQALLAQEQGADYLGVGAVFATATKPESEPLGLQLLRSVTERINIPVFAIGGIKENNACDLLSFGASGVAVSSAICCARDPALATRSFVNILNS
jgi:thiamine-phosphate pyrophosphorylase